jgi:hypothetical protein
MSGATPSRVRVQTRISSETYAMLKKTCAARRVSLRAALETAVREYVEGFSDPLIIMRRFDRLGRAQDRLQRDVDLFMEAFAVFLKLWFAHTPAVAPDARRAAQSSAEARYQQFVAYLGEQFSGGHRFLQDLPETALDNRDKVEELGEGHKR